MEAAKAWSEGGLIDSCKEEPLEELELGAMDDVMGFKALEGQEGRSSHGRFLGTG